MGIGIKYGFSLVAVKKAIVNSKSYNQIYTYLGISCKGGNCNKQIKMYIEENKLDISHFTHRSQKTYSRVKYTDEELFSIDYVIRGGADSKRLIDKLVSQGKLYKCDECGITSWNNKPIRLQLEHLDGNNRNNTKENLAFLCPNCHSQTSTFAGGNRKIGGIIHKDHKE